MEGIKLANLAARFLLELCALAALGYWGFQVGQTLIAKIVLAIGIPVFAAIVWGTFIAPRASVQVPTWLWVALQVVVFGSAAAGLFANGQGTLAAIFVLAVMVNSALLYAWRR